MIKEKIKGFARTLGVNFCGTEHLGVDLELDLTRLTADEPLKTIFDVGGNFGQTALKLAAAFPAAAIFTFEPIPTSFDRLQRAVTIPAHVGGGPSALSISGKKSLRGDLRS